MTRTAATEAAYLRKGKRHLRTAQARHPDIDDPVEALVTDFESKTSTLTLNTTSVYRQEHGSVIRFYCALKGASDAAEAEAVARIEQALRRRRGKPKERRTASRKVNDPTKAQLRKVLAQILIGAKRGDGARFLALGVTMFFLAKFGCRVVELSSARIEGTLLVLRNAKYGNGRAGAKTRAIPLGFLTEDEGRALPIALNLVRDTMSLYGKTDDDGVRATYERWHRAAAELLARCCRAAGVERLNLYSFRHVAIATWRKAGLTPWQIAALAGHASIATARHYGRGSSGWQIGSLPTAEAADVAALEAAGGGSKPPLPWPAPDSEAAKAVSVPDMDLEDFPMPPPPAPSAERERGTRHFREWRDTVQNPRNKQLDAILTEHARRGGRGVTDDGVVVDQPHGDARLRP